jgi:hypothetical protein
MTAEPAALLAHGGTFGDFCHRVPVARLDEIKRLLLALQTSGTGKERMSSTDPSNRSLDWFLCLEKPEPETTGRRAVVE